MSDMSKKYYKIVSLVNGLLGVTFSVVFVLLWFNLIFDIPFDDWWFGLTPFFLFVFNFLSVLFFIFHIRPHDRDAWLGLLISVVIIMIFLVPTIFWRFEP